MKDVAERGYRVVAVLPYHYPRPLLAAHGFHPLELWGPPGVPRDDGGRHFQSYTCDIVVRATSFLLRGGLDGMDAILIPHTCDALQGMGSVVRDFLPPGKPVLTLYLPRGSRSSDREYLIEELRRLHAQLAQITGREPEDGDWAAAFAVEEASDRALAGLYRRRKNLAVTDREFYTVVRSREFLPAEDFAALAARLPEGRPRSGGTGLLLSGIVPEPFELFDRINEMGAWIAADDLACGRRRLYATSRHPDPFERMADLLLGNPPDPTRGSPIEARARWLTDRMAEAGARGMLVYDPKFCEPELFDVPLLRRHLGAAGYPLLHIEVELGGSVPHQVLTRIEAFVETLQ